ncbi:alpha-N-acetylgalactosaminide alpha-2,6-sialyltransferase 1-like [Scleropages formosus]|uniref:alpha-N-acetylgalactosaminide alpha-2,6-sialyltransferase 1-like n=1 Tax=Scleropages formosus TaxID=113540 RepID=UPI0010FA73C4|nr:alpha-N-acetylgalactosaminide alpha-2,6-sialyltransferase 1-like [Scleropages formosus]
MALSVISENFSETNETNSAEARTHTGAKPTIKAHPVSRRLSYTVNKKGNSKFGLSTVHHTANITTGPIMNKKSFSKMPKWDFEEKYIQDTHPKQMTCQESLRNTADPEFNRSFIPNIQLFMHREHLNMSEWNRLTHFNNPFGFMGYHYKDVKTAVDLIPKTADNFLTVPRNDKSKCIRCAVVGTGGILSGSLMGKEIDSHDYVFRMNGAVIKGYEEDVGNRTSVYVHTMHSTRASLYLLEKYGFKSIPRDENIKYVLIPEGVRDFQWLLGLLQKKPIPEGDYSGIRPWTYYPDNMDLNRFYVLHPDFLRYVKNRFLKSKILQSPSWHVYRPTNGAFTLFLALHACDVVDAYGFVTADYSKYSNYYYDKLKAKVTFYGNHDYNLEMNLWKKLHDSEIIRLYQRQEDTEDSRNKTSKH